MKQYKHLIRNLNRTPEERIQAAFNLENVADKESIDALGNALLADPSPVVRHECAFALGETAAPEQAGRYLMEAIKKDPQYIVKHEALLALATLGDKSFATFIKKWLDHPDQIVSESAEIALQRLTLS